MGQLRFLARALLALAVPAFGAAVGCSGSEFNGDGTGGQAGNASAGASGSGGSATGGSSGSGGTSGTGGGSAGIGGTGGGSGGSGGSAGAAGSGGTGGGAGGSAGSSGSAGMGGMGGLGSTLDLTNFCAVTADLLCDARQDCCLSSHGFIPADCRQNYLDDCAMDIADVIATQKTFDPTHIDECKDGLERIFSTCTPTAAETLEEFAALRACGLIFQGQKTQGQTCARDSDCRQSTDPTVSFTCGGLLQFIGLGTCRRATVRAEGGACEVGAGADALVLCEPGLWCDVTADIGVGTPPFQGICQPAAPVGDSCALVGGFDIQCGIGAYCDVAATPSPVCAAGQPGGSACNEGNECSSLVCNPGTALCAELVPYVTARDCGVP